MRRYLLLFLLLFVTEVAIVLFDVHKFVRGFIGDLLVIPLLYTFLRLITKLSWIRALILVLLAAFMIEFFQLIPVVEKYTIQNKALLLVLGDTFDPWDLIAYGLGVIPVLIIEKIIHHGT